MCNVYPSYLNNLGLENNLYYNTHTECVDVFQPPDRRRSCGRRCGAEWTQALAAMGPPPPPPPPPRDSTIKRRLNINTVNSWENSFPGCLLPVTSGRIKNLFNLFNVYVHCTMYSMYLRCRPFSLLRTDRCVAIQIRILLPDPTID